MNVTNERLREHMAKNLPQKFNFELQLQSVKCSHRKCFQHNIRSLACKFVYHVWEGVECVCVPMLNWISYTSVTYVNTICYDTISRLQADFPLIERSAKINFAGTSLLVDVRMRHL